MKFSLIPKEEKFFVIFEKASQNLLECARAFQDLMKSFQDVQKKVDQIVEYEHRGDDFTHEIVQALNQTFVTPLDREDIYRLAESLDDVLDQIEDAASGLALYEVSQPTEYAIEFSNLIMHCCEQIHKAMPYLRNLKRLHQVQDNLLEIHTLENRADSIKKSALSELFKHPEDVISLLKWREIYEHMETATDKCEDVADVLQGLLVKHA